MQVRILGDLKIKEENDGVTFSWQGLEYSEIPVTQVRITQIRQVFERFKPDSPLWAIDFAIQSGDLFFLEEWRERVINPDYIAWLKAKFLEALNAA